MKQLLCLFFALAFVFSLNATQRVYLNQSAGNQVTMSYDATPEIYYINTVGNDPYVITNGLSRTLTDDERFLHVECLCTSGLDMFQIYFGNSYSASRLLSYGPIEASTQWQTLELDLSGAVENFGWGFAGLNMRIDLGNNSGKSIQLRNLYVHARDERVALTIPNEDINQVTYSASGGVYSFQTTGEDPHVRCSALPRNLFTEETALYFEYKSTTGINDLQLFFGNTWSEARSKHCGGFAATDDWTPVEIDLSSEVANFKWKWVGQYLRMDFGTQSGKQISIRNIFVQPKGGIPKDRKFDLANHLNRYLYTPYNSRVDYVYVDNNVVSVQGTANGSGSFYLVEVPPYVDVTEETHFETRIPIQSGNFDVTTERHANRNGHIYDRALSKWAIVRANGNTDELVSTARYADEVEAKRNPEPIVLKNKKGLGSDFDSPYFMPDVKEMNIGSINVNVELSDIVAISPNTFSDCSPYEYGGRTYYINNVNVRQLDERCKGCTDLGVVVNAIILVASNPRDAEVKKTIVYPGNTGGYFTMPNLTTLEGTMLYAAFFNFLADHYSSGEYGRINNLIMHNEIDCGQTWTNMGTVPVMTFMDAYNKSIRLAYNIFRQYDQNVWVLQSQTNYWNVITDNGAGYSTHNMLRKTLDFIKVEGDFKWGVALHSYPCNMFEPRFWIYDTEATYDLDTKRLSFKNLEVMHHWMLAPSHLYKGKTKRICFLSENGTHSPDYTSSSLGYQAAGAAWAWMKTKKLSGIDAIQWHNFLDNRYEGGLMIGLRYFNDYSADPSGKKPAWYVWQVADTDGEEGYYAHYRNVIGISSWDDIMHLNLTGVEEVKIAQEELDVYATDGAVVNKKHLDLVIVDVNGNVVANGSDERIALPTGVYVVSNASGATKKVVVK